MRNPSTPEQDQEIVVFIVRRETACAECGKELHKGHFLRMERNKPLCLACADLDRLEFLGRGDAAVTRRAKKHSKLWAVVVEWSRARKRYERQGLLVEPQAIDRAVEESEADAEVRAARREREAARREALDRDYVAAFARAVREQFPSAPTGAETAIAEHACEKHSGRVGRSAAAKAFDEDAVFLAVRAHVRHARTNYDELLFRYGDRGLAREEVRERVEEILREWSAPRAPARLRRRIG
jgi:hypothetical protein